MLFRSELADQLQRAGVELRLASVRAKALGMLRRSGLAARLEIAPTVDAALGRSVRGGLLGGQQPDADEIGGMDPGIRE